MPPNKHNKPRSEIQSPPRAAAGNMACAIVRKLRRPDFQTVSRRGLKWLQSPALNRVPGLVHAFSTRAGGASQPPAEGLNLGFVKSDRPARVTGNRKRFLGALGVAGLQLAEVHQIHSTVVTRLAREPRGKLVYLYCDQMAPARSGSGSPPGDALVTDQPGILLAVRCADCVPVLLADADRPAVGAVHAGWKGMLNGIVEKTVGEMRRLFGSRPSRLTAAIGPSIRACCYEVGEEVAAAYGGRFPNAEKFLSRADARKIPSDHQPFSSRFFSLSPLDPRANPAPCPHLNLIAVAQYQLRRAGVPVAHIHVADYCTACRTDLFFSHRKEGSRTGRMMAVIGIRR
jgi:YfiH family protein